MALSAVQSNIKPKQPALSQRKSNVGTARPSLQRGDVGSRKSTFQANNNQARNTQMQKKTGAGQTMRGIRPSRMPQIPSNHSLNRLQQPAANDNQEFGEEPINNEEITEVQPEVQQTEQTSQTADTEEEQQQLSINQAIQQARIQGALAEAAGIQAQQGEGGSAAEDAAKNVAQDAAKKAAKKAIPRGAAFVANGIAGVLDLSTAGIAIIIDIFIYMFSLGYLNYEMFTGQLNWDPIPMPIDKDGTLLKGLVIFADIMVVLMLIVCIGILVLTLMIMFAPILLAGYFGTEAIAAFLK